MGIAKKKDHFTFEANIISPFSRVTSKVFCIHIPDVNLRLASQKLGIDLVESVDATGDYPLFCKEKSAFALRLCKVQVRTKRDISSVSPKTKLMPKKQPSMTTQKRYRGTDVSGVEKKQ